MKPFLLLILTASLFTSCGIFKRTSGPIAFRLDFSTGKLYDTLANKEGKTSEPLFVESGKTLTINVTDYNPLSTQFSINDSSVTYFLSDTSRLSSFFVFPTIANSAEGEQFQSETIATMGTGTQLLTFIKTKKPDDACSQLKAALSDLNETNKNQSNAILQYQRLIVAIDGIKDIYSRFKTYKKLDKNLIQAALKDEFIAEVNASLPNGPVVGPDADKIKPSQLINAKNQLYQKVISLKVELSAVKAAFDKIDETKCPKEYPAYYKKFNDMYIALAARFATVESNQTEKVEPGFGKSMEYLTTLQTYLTEIPSTILVTPKPILDDEHYLQIYTITGDGKKLYRTILAKPRNGFKVDVSAGLFGSTLTDYAFAKTSMDSIYHTQYLVEGQVRDTTKLQSFTKISKQGQAKFSYGGVIYINGHWQSGHIVNWGFSLGVGALLNDQTRWALMLGPSIIFNGKGASRFVITPSLIYAQVDRLSSEYETDTWYAKAIDNIPTRKSWQPGFALGVSWNFK